MLTSFSPSTALRLLPLSLAGIYMSFFPLFFAFALLRTHVVVVVAVVIVVVISPDATLSRAPQCIRLFRQSSMSSPACATILRIPAIASTEGIPQGSGNLAPNSRRRRRLSLSLSHLLSPRLYRFMYAIPTTRIRVSPRCPANVTGVRHVERSRPLSFVQLFLAWTGGTVRTPPPPLCLRTLVCTVHVAVVLFCLCQVYFLVLAPALPLPLPLLNLFCLPLLFTLPCPPLPSVACFYFTLAYSTRYFSQSFFANTPFASTWLSRKPDATTLDLSRFRISPASGTCLDA